MLNDLNTPSQQQVLGQDRNKSTISLIPQKEPAHFQAHSFSLTFLFLSWDSCSHQHSLQTQLFTTQICGSGIQQDQKQLQGSPLLYVLFCILLLFPPKNEYLTVLEKLQFLSYLSEHCIICDRKPTFEAFKL